jgi:hypothetical protein
LFLRKEKLPVRRYFRKQAIPACRSQELKIESGDIG